MQETSATEVCVLVQLLSSGKGVRLGLAVEEGGRVPGSCVAHPSLPDRLERARPFLALKQLNFWMQFSPQPGRFMN